MRIGFFTDTYHPTINGITYVVDSLKHHLEAEGHTVYVFCPARTISASVIRERTSEDDHIIWIPSVKNGFFDTSDYALFFPPTILRKIQDLDLDIIHIFTPAQVGTLGVNAASKYDIPFIVQHCTDLYEFVEDYPNVLPGILALVNIVFPLSVKLQWRDIIEIVKLQRPRLGRVKWSQDIIKRALTMIYSRADAVIALSRKSKVQLESWQDEIYFYDVTLMPNGVDAIPRPTKAQIQAFRQRWGIESDDEVVGYVGRLGEEKNLPLLIEAFDVIGRERPHAKLIFVGDFDYRQTLEEMAAQSCYSDRIIFTGSIPREELGVAYASLDVFAFPSLKDTQGWAIHEAAHASKPLILVDRELSEVMRDGENGYFANNDPADMAAQVLKLLCNTEQRQQFGRRSKQLALRFTERNQVRKLIRLYESVISKHNVAAQLPSEDRFGLLSSVLHRARTALGRSNDQE